MSAFQTAAGVLAAVVAGLTAREVDVPARRYVAPGPFPAWDDEQLTVAVVRPAVPGTPGREAPGARPCGGPRFLELSLQLVRCLPLGDGDDPATPEQLTETSERLLDDADQLRQVLNDAEPLSGRRGVPTHVGAVTIVGPEGGLVAVVVVLQVGL